MSKRFATWPKNVQWVIGLLVAVAAALAIGWLLFVPAADWLATHDVGHVAGVVRPLRLQTARDAARGRLLTYGAGLFAAAALIFTALNFNLLRKNSEKADQWQQRIHELTQQGQVTDRYTRAIEQLGSDKLAVRIGGIYALERIARDSARDHPAVMEVLTAFIREQSHEQLGSTDPDSPVQERFIRPDVQAAVTVVGRRDAERVYLEIDLARAHLARAHLVAAKLDRANLVGAVLSGADLSFAHLDGAHLDGAHLDGADLFSAYLSGADLTGADLTGATLFRSSVASAIITGAKLAGAFWPGPDPDGWQLDDSGRLEASGTDTGPAEAN